MSKDVDDLVDKDEFFAAENAGLDGSSELQRKYLQCRVLPSWILYTAIFFMGMSFVVSAGYFFQWTHNESKDIIEAKQNYQQVVDSYKETKQYVINQQTEIANNQKQLDSLVVQREALEKEVAALTQTKQEIDAYYQEYNLKKDSLEKEYASKQESYQELSTMHGKLQNEVNETNAQLESLKGLVAKNREYEKRNQQLSKERKELEQEIASLETKVASLDNQVKERQTAMRNLLSQDGEMVKLSQDLSEMIAAYTQQVSSLQDTGTKLNGLTNTLIANQDSAESFVEQMRDLSNEAKTVGADILSASKDVASSRDKLNSDSQSLSKATMAALSSFEQGQKSFSDNLEQSQKSFNASVEQSKQALDMSTAELKNANNALTAAKQDLLTTSSKAAQDLNQTVSQSLSTEVGKLSDVSTKLAQHDAATAQSATALQNAQTALTGQVSQLQELVVRLGTAATNLEAIKVDPEAASQQQSTLQELQNSINAVGESLNQVQSQLLSQIQAQQAQQAQQPSQDGSTQQ